MAMKMKMNPEGQGLWDDVEEPEKVVKLNPDDQEPAESKTQPWFKPKVGSVIPAKRRQVKERMFDCLVQSLSGRPSVSGASQSNNANGCSKKSPPPKLSNDKKKIQREGETVMSVMSEPEMVIKLNPAGKVVCTKVEPEKVVKLSTEPRFKPKIGSVIPTRRRSVKRMMFDSVAKSIAHVFRRRPPLSSSAVPQYSNSTNNCFKKSKPVYPHHI